MSESNAGPAVASEAASQQLAFLPGHGVGAGGCAFAAHPEGVCLLTGGADGLICERDATSGAVVTERKLAGDGAASAVLALAASRTGGQIATGEKNGYVKVVARQATPDPASLFRSVMCSLLKPCMQLHMSWRHTIHWDGDACNFSGPPDTYLAQVTIAYAV